MKKVISMALIIIIMPVFSITGFASSGVSEGTFIDGLSDFGSNMLDGIIGFVSPIIDSIGEGVDAVGNFFVGIGQAIANGVSYLLDGIKALFVPKENFFSEQFQRIHDIWSNRFGGLIATADYLKGLFNNLTKSRQTSGLFTLNFNESTSIGTRSIDLLQHVRFALPLVRGALSGFITFLTVSICYKQVKELINT